MIDEYIKKWIIKASHDLKTSEIVIKQSGNDKKVLTDSICFHNQQAVEKLLKAYLLYKNEDFSKTHDIDYLLELCRKHDKDFNAIDVGNLSDYGVKIRYPDDFYIPSI